MSLYALPVQVVQLRLALVEVVQIGTLHGYPSMRLIHLDTFQC